MATNTQFSYDFNHPKQDIQGVFDDMIVNNPTLLSRFGVISGTTNGRKHKWFERQLSQRSTTITGFDTDGDGTGITVGSTAGMKAYDVLYFEGSDGSYISEKVQIVSVDSGTELTVTRDYGGDTGVTLAVSDVVKISNQVAENADYTVDSVSQPVEYWNETKIYDKALEMTVLGDITPVEGIVYGQDAVKVFDWLKQLKLQIIWEMIDDFIHGTRIAASNITTAKGLCGGFPYFANGGITETTGGSISLTHFNNISESLQATGAGVSSGRILVMNTNQARKVSALGTSGTNPLTFRNEGSSSTGGWVTSVVGDLPGNINEIVIAEQMPKDQIWVIDPSMIKMVIQKPLEDTDATDKSKSALTYARRLVTAITWEIKNGKTAHGIISGLNI